MIRMNSTGNFFEQRNKPSADIKCVEIYVHLSVTQTFLACGPLLTWKITADAHMYIECPEDK
jgi:hypothetical protein